MGMGGGKGGMPGMGAGGALGFMSGGNTPQDWGQGISNSPFQPYNTGPGIQQGQDPYAGSRMQMGPFGQIWNEYGQNYTPYDAQGNPLTQSPLSMDFMSPGVGEQWQQQNQSAFLGPGNSQNYYNQAMGQYGMGGPGMSNYSEQAYKNFNAPDIASDPGLQPYYDRAAQNLSSNLNQQFAGRGMYGSSAAMNELEHGLGGLASEQANREAQYNLQRLGEQRAWEGLGGQLAGQADMNSRQANQNQLQWMQGLGGLAGAADQSQLARALGGMNAASAAQGMARERGQDYFGNLMGASGALAGMAGNSYDDMLSTDSQLMNNSLMLESGLAQAALQGSLYNQQRQKDDAMWAKSMMGGGGGGGGGLLKAAGK